MTSNIPGQENSDTKEETIHIAERDIPEEEPPVEVSHSDIDRYWKENSILDLKSGFYIGNPPRKNQQDLNFKEFPNEPHVFKVHHLTILKDEGERINIDDVNVLLYHGFNPTGKLWLFANGEEVVKSVNAFNRRKEKSKQIEVVATCNRIDYSNDIKIIMPEFEDIVHVVGTRMSGILSYEGEESSDLKMRIEIPKDGVIFNADALSIRKRITVL